jgi:protein-disulfide isomerase
VAYTEEFRFVPFAVAAGLFAALLALRFVQIPWKRQAAALLGVAVWVALLRSGIDPVIAGLAVGLIVSAYPPARTDLEQVTRLTRLFREQPTPALARSAQLGVASAISPNDRLQYRLHPWTSYVIVPLFALANAGIHLNGSLLRDAAGSPIVLGIVVGYLVGKPAGILGASWIVTRLWPGIRLSLSWPTIAGGGVVAGIGFTVSLLISNLAFHGRALEEAKLGVLVAAVLAAVGAWAAFRLIALLPASVRFGQVARTAEEITDLAEDIDPGHDHVRGADDATVTLVEYGDYECPYCGQAEIVIRELLGSFGDDLRYVWRSLPLNDVHPDAQVAAEAAEAAAAQGRFWDMHDTLLANQDHLLPPDLARYAQEIGLDVERFSDDLRRRKYAERVSDDVASADASGVAGTPTFFINGRRYEGAYDADTLTGVVQRARKSARVRAGAQREEAGPKARL